MFETLSALRTLIILGHTMGYKMVANVATSVKLLGASSSSALIFHVHLSALSVMHQSALIPIVGHTLKSLSVVVEQDVIARFVEIWLFVDSCRVSGVVFGFHWLILCLFIFNLSRLVLLGS